MGFLLPEPTLLHHSIDRSHEIDTYCNKGNHRKNVVGRISEYSILCEINNLIGNEKSFVNRSQQKQHILFFCVRSTVPSSLPHATTKFMPGFTEQA